MNATIVMAKEYWENSPLSIARYYGGIRIQGRDYVIVNKEGKDLFECSMEAMKAGREKAIEPGEPADLVDKKFVPIYRKVGREQFIKWVEAGLDYEAMQKKLKKKGK